MASGDLIRPDTIVQVPIQDGQLMLSPAFDVLHYFKGFDTYILKYWGQDTQNMHNVMITNDGARFLLDRCGLYVVEREFMFRSEHDAHVAWQADQLDDHEWGLE